MITNAIRPVRLSAKIDNSLQRKNYTEIRGGSEKNFPTPVFTVLGAPILPATSKQINANEIGKSYRPRCSMCLYFAGGQFFDRIIMFVLPRSLFRRPRNGENPARPAKVSHVIELCRVSRGWSRMDGTQTENFLSTLSIWPFASDNRESEFSYTIYRHTRITYRHTCITYIYRHTNTHTHTQNKCEVCDASYA